jgi:hypothetical protein
MEPAANSVEREPRDGIAHHGWHVGVSRGRPTLLSERVNLAAFDEIDGRIEDHPIARFDAIAYLERSSQIARQHDLPDACGAIFDHGNLQSLPIENDGRSGHEQRGRLARDVRLDRAIDPGCLACRVPTGKSCCETGMLDAVKVPGPTGAQWYVSPASLPKATGDLKQWEAERARHTPPQPDMCPGLDPAGSI